MDLVLNVDGDDLSYTLSRSRPPVPGAVFLHGGRRLVRVSVRPGVLWPVVLAREAGVAGSQDHDGGVPCTHECTR